MKEWLNYHHRLYFWLVVREGGLAPAAAKLRLSPPTLSAQVHALENTLGEKLLEKRGRKLELTGVGRVVYRYAEEIFTIGRELQDTLQGRPTGRPLRLVVGIANAVPKLMARRLLSPAQKMGQPVQIGCREDQPERLLAALAMHELDAVLSDSPRPREGRRRQGLQPPARRVRRHLVRRERAGQETPAWVPGIPRRRPRLAPHRDRVLSPALFHRLCLTLHRDAAGWIPRSA